MSKRAILQSPDPLVRTVCVPVTVFDESLKALADDLVETLRASTRPGVGLSSNQIGDLRRVFIVDLRSTSRDASMAMRPLVFVNPEITKRRGEQRRIEGCLSLTPADDRLVARSKIINWVAQDLDGNRISGKMCDFMAVVFQHEMDHMDGILIVDKERP